MKLKHLGGGLLLAPAAALLLAALPEPVQADPPSGNRGAARSHGLPPGAQKFGRGGHCPPGLRDKGCVPPGLQKFRRGDYIPHDVVYRRVYYGEYDLPRPRSGYFYANVGGDIYLLAEATQRVIEAINLVDLAGQ